MTDKKESEEMLWMSQAYADAALHLCESMLDEEFDFTEYKVKVPLFLIHQSLELCFKAAILKSSGSYKKSHELIRLQEEFERLYPKYKYELPSLISGLHKGWDDLFGTVPDRIEGPQHERFRYYKDRKGNPWPNLDLNDVKEFKCQIEDVRHFIQGVFVNLIFGSGNGA